MDAFGTAAAALGVLDQVHKFIKKICALKATQDNLRTALENHTLIVEETMRVIRLIEEQKPLKTQNTQNVLSHIEKTGRAMTEKLQSMCAKIEKDGKVVKVGRLLIFGPGQLDKLEKMFKNLAEDKGDLGTCLTLVGVGVIADIGKEVRVNTAVVQEMDRKLRATLGDDYGLKMKLVIRDKKVDANGCAVVPKEDLSELATTLEPVAQPNDDPGEVVVKRRIIKNNIAQKEAYMMNAPIGEDIWAHIDWVEIVDNRADEGAFLFAYPTSEEATFRVLDNKLESKKLEIELRKIELERERIAAGKRR